MSDFSISVILKAVNRTQATLSQAMQGIKNLGTSADTTKNAINSMSLGGVVAGSAVSQSINKITSSVGTLQNKLLILQASFTKMAGPEGIAGKLKQTSENLKSGGLATAFSLAPAAMAGKTAMEWEEALGGISTMTDKSTKQIKDLYEKDLFAVARSAGLSLNDVGEGAYQALSAGVPETGLIEFMKKASMAAKLGRTNITTAIDGMTSVMNTYQMSADMVGSAMFSAQVVGKTDFGLIAQSIGQVAPLAKEMEVSFQDLMAATAALTRKGLPTAEAFTAIRGILVSTAKATNQQKQALSEMGINFNVDTIKAKGFKGALQEVALATKKAQSMVDPEKKAKAMGLLNDVFGRVEAMGGFLALTTQEGVEAYDQTIKMGNNANLMTEVNAKRGEMAMHAWKNLKTEIQILSVEIMTNLAPAFKEFSTWIIQMTANLRKFAKDNPELVKTIGIVILSIVGLKVAAIAAGFALGGISYAITILGTAAAGITFILRGITIALAPLVAHPIIALAAGVFILYQNWDKVSSAIIAAKNALTSLFDLSKENQELVDSVLHPIFNYAKPLTDILTGNTSATATTSTSDMFAKLANSGLGVELPAKFAGNNISVSTPVNANITINTNSPVNGKEIVKEIQPVMGEVLDSAARQSFKTIPGSR